MLLAWILSLNNIQHQNTERLGAPRASCGHVMQIIRSASCGHVEQMVRMTPNEVLHDRACLLPLVARRTVLALLSPDAQKASRKPEAIQRDSKDEAIKGKAQNASEALTAILERGGLEGSVEGRESPLTASKRLPGRLVRTEEVAREAIQSAYRLSQRHRTKSIPQEVSGRVRERSEWRPRNLLRDARGR